jgi:hypothetical protein
MRPDVRAGKKPDALQVPPEQQPVFSVSPDKVLLPPKEAISFVIAGSSGKPGACHGTARG